MIHWIPYAFLRIVLFFVAGICLGIYFPDILGSRVASVLFLTLALSYTTTFAFQGKKLLTPGNLKVAAGIIGLSAVFMSGYLQVLKKKEILREDHIVHVQSAMDFYKVVLSANPVEKASTWKVVAEVESVRTSAGWRAASGNVLLYLSKKDFPAYRYGDVLVIKGSPKRVPGPANPGEFDYQRYLSFKNIYHQQFVKKGDAIKIAFEPRSWVEQNALASRQWADETLRNNISGEREKALASGLVLGVTDGLDNELLNAYKATGAMHVLSVSGLHVGILYGLVLFLLTPLKKLKSGPWIIAGLSIVILWAYAFITGLSPSVLRAVTMFSFVALSIPAGRRTNIYNTLCASAFCILWYDPFLIMSVGFQLSYLAVLGIVYLQPILYNLWEPTHRLWDELWKGTCVSIAAQVATTALGLFYFYQFPNYFLLSNLFVIPGSFVVLILGIVVLVVSFISPVASFLGMLLGGVIKCLNFIIFSIEDIPFSVTENVYITTLQCWLLMFMIVAALLLLHTRKFSMVIVISGLGIIFSLSRWHHVQQHFIPEKVTVYNVSGHSAIDLIESGRAVFFADDELKNNAGKINFHITPHRVKAGVGITNFPGDLQRILPGCALVVWKGKSFLRIYDSNFVVPDGLSVDFVIVSNNAVPDIEELQRRIQFHQLVLDSSNSYRFATRILNQHKTSSIKVLFAAQPQAFSLERTPGS